MELDKTIGFLFGHRRVDYDTGCWEWTGGKNPAGYGVINGARPHYLAQGLVHRLSAVVFLGLERRDPRLVLHQCDNPPCFNYSHLKIGTHAQNMHEMAARGRAVMPNSKLTWIQVRHIRAYPATVAMREIAAEYGVTTATISNIVRNVTYPDPTYTAQFRYQPGQVRSRGNRLGFPKSAAWRTGDLQQGSLFQPG